MNRCWLESDIMGSVHVMVQAEGLPPFNHSSFHYQYPYTDNTTRMQAAVDQALRLGATEPVEQRFRTWPSPATHPEQPK